MCDGNQIYPIFVFIWKGEWFQMGCEIFSALFFLMYLFLLEQHMLNFSALKVWGFSFLSFLTAPLPCSSIRLQVLIQDLLWKGLLKFSEKSGGHAVMVSEGKQTFSAPEHFLKSKDACLLSHYSRGSPGFCHSLF